jgi:hypothetical protein
MIVSGTTAPEGSVTVPLSEEVCARADKVASKSVSNTFFIRRFLL